VESYAPLMARAPQTFNFFINQPLVRQLSEKHIGMVDLPQIGKAHPELLSLRHLGFAQLVHEWKVHRLLRPD
ncbi:hypothetical protein EST46_25335, partial [Escherichia coli]|nr:hypothetical protein [Escherichia coli]